MTEPGLVVVGASPLYRRGDRLVGALAINQPGKIMKYRTKIAAGIPFAEALDFAGAGVR